MAASESAASAQSHVRPALWCADGQGHEIKFEKDAKGKLRKLGSGSFGQVCANPRDGMFLSHMYAWFPQQHAVCPELLAAPPLTKYLCASWCVHAKNMLLSLSNYAVV